MIRVGVLSFSDGRQRVHDGLAPYVREQEPRIKFCELKGIECEVIE